MSSEVLHTDLQRELATTRRHLERLPSDHLGWKPHERSASLGRLGCHLVECVQWVPSIVTRSAHDGDELGFPRVGAETTEALLAAWDEAAAAALAAFEGLGDAGLKGGWAMTMGGRTVMEKDKADALRDMTLHHLIHHRGQLTVYLRMLDVPLAWTYGPTADEPMTRG